MRSLTLKKEMEVAKLKEHPKNRELFTDIRESHPAFWLEFKDSIKRFGIIEPLLVNKDTKEIRSGNQRFKAAVELELKTVPVIFIDDDADEDEVGQMIASNVYRRQIDPFALFEYIAQLRRGHHGRRQRPDVELEFDAASEATAKQVHKPKSFVSASDIFATLTPEQREELKAKFEGDMNHSEGKLIAELRKIESEKIEAMAEYKKAHAAAAESEEREKAKQEAIERMEAEIQVLKARDSEEELAARDAQIRALEKAKATLTKKLKEPDINKRLDECIQHMSQIDIVLADLLKNRDALDPDKLQQFGELMVSAHATMRNCGEAVLQIEEVV